MHMDKVVISMEMIRLSAETFEAFRMGFVTCREGFGQIGGRWSGGAHLPLGGGEVGGEEGTGRFQQTIDPLEHGVGLLSGQRVYVEVLSLLWRGRSRDILHTKTNSCKCGTVRAEENPQ